MNGYIAIWQGKRIEIHADTSYGAQCAAEIEFKKGTRKKVKGYDINVILCELGGEQVVHTAS